MKIAEKVKEFFHNEGIHSTTIQPEFLELENMYNTTGWYIVGFLILFFIRIKYFKTIDFFCIL